MIRDYKYRGTAARPMAAAFGRRHRPRLLLGLAAAALAFTAWGLRGAEAPPPRPETPPQRVEIELPLPLSASPAPPAASAPAGDDAAPARDAAREWRVQPGDTLSGLFQRAGLPAADLAALLAADGPAARLQKLRPGDRLRTAVGADGRLAKLEYWWSRTAGLRAVRDEDGFTVEALERPLEIRLAHAGGIIEDSLFNAARAAGLSDRKAVELADIFAWDIDFVLEVRRGDRFTVVYEQHFVDGEAVGEGPIVAAEFVNQGRAYRALRYTDPEGRSDYYTPDGTSLRKAFLRNPVDFMRISSGFSLGRRHPILNTIRAHKGVDYAAPTGTPVKAAGDGRVVFRGRKGGYGNTVILQHGARYSTLYAHLSRFARGLGVGDKVRQGQIIGYVGQTGLATGPHLHYEFRVDGAHRNPLTVQLPSARPVPEGLRADFQRQTAPRLAALEALNRNRYALDTRDAAAPQG